MKALKINSKIVTLIYSYFLLKPSLFVATSMDVGRGGKGDLCPPLSGFLHIMQQMFDYLRKKYSFCENHSNSRQPS